MPVEIDAIKGVLEMSTSERAAAIDKVMDKELQVFLKVRTQLHSLMIFWERVIHAKNRLDTEGRKFRGEETMDVQSCLIGLKIIPRRCTIGLSALAEATSSSSRSVQKRKATPMPDDSGSETMDNELQGTAKHNLKQARRKRGDKEKDVEDTTSDEEEEDDQNIEYDNEDDAETTEGEDRRGRKRKRSSGAGRPRAALKDQPKKGRSRGSKSAQGSAARARPEKVDSEDEHYKSRIAKLLRK